MKNVFYLMCLLLIYCTANAQIKIGDNPTNINSASLLELEASNKGLVFPKVALNSATSPAPLPPGLLTGTVVYNTNAAAVNGRGAGLFVWSGSEWVAVGDKIKSDDAWLLTGNPATSADSSFLGTTDNVSLHIRTNNLQRILVDSSGSVAIGLPNFNPSAVNKALLLVDYGNTNSHTVANFRGGINSHLQLNVQNTSSGNNASSDYVATADNGTDSTFYSDMGINSSTFSPSAKTWGGAHDAYFYSFSRNLVIGTKRLGSDLIFLTGGGIIGDNSAMRINGRTRNIVIGNGEGTDTPQGNTIRGPNGGGTNIAGGNLTIRGGNGTGSAAGGNLYLFGGISRAGRSGEVNISGDVISLRSPSLNIAGVQPTASLATDSVLTVFSGSLKKAPYSSVFPVLKNLLTVTLPSLGNNSGVNVDLTIPNIPYVAGGPNPVVAVNPEVDLPDGLIIAWVRVFAANSVRIHFRNVTNTTIDSQPIQFDVSVIK